MIAVSFGNSDFAARLGAMADALQRPAELANSLGARLRTLLQRHFLGKDKTPNKLGGDRTHFWRDVSTSVSAPEVSGDGLQVSVSITDPNFAQKLYGGPIRANRGFFLTIPVSSRAHGRTASNLERDDGIQLVFVKKPFGGLLIEPPFAPGAPVKVHYVLKSEVQQAADPTALPETPEVQADLLKTGGQVIERAVAMGRGKSIQ